ncbi:hypothetical protein [Mesorhizobium japonicum]|uniref:hypothetical protein n=1 Tax=Mesorhizobium japonicum TaxID=2066070 RepID=UPI003B5C4C14
MSDAPSSPDTGYSAGDAIRPLSVRMRDAARAQLEVLAQLNGRSMTEEVRLALEAWVETSRSNPEVLARAEQVRLEIEHDADMRRDAIKSIFDQPSNGRAARSRAKGGDE